MRRGGRGRDDHRAGPAGIRRAEPPKACHRTERATTSAPVLVNRPSRRSVTPSICQISVAPARRADPVRHGPARSTYRTSWGLGTQIPSYPRRKPARRPEQARTWRGPARSGRRTRRAGPWHLHARPGPAWPAPVERRHDPWWLAVSDLNLVRRAERRGHLHGEGRQPASLVQAHGPLPGKLVPAARPGSRLLPDIDTGEPQNVPDGCADLGRRGSRDDQCERRRRNGGRQARQPAGTARSRRRRREAGAYRGGNVAQGRQFQPSSEVAQRCLHTCVAVFSHRSPPRPARRPGPGAACGAPSTAATSPSRVASPAPAASPLLRGPRSAGRRRRDGLSFSGSWRTASRSAALAAASVSTSGSPWQTVPAASGAARSSVAERR